MDVKGRAGATLSPGPYRFSTQQVGETKTSICRSVSPKGLASCSWSPMPHTRYYTFWATVELIHPSAWKANSRKLGECRMARWNYAPKANDASRSAF